MRGMKARDKDRRTLGRDIEKFMCTFLEEL